MRQRLFEKGDIVGYFPGERSKSRLRDGVIAGRLFASGKPAPMNPTYMVVDAMRGNTKHMPRLLIPSSRIIRVSGSMRASPHWRRIEQTQSRVMMIGHIHEHALVEADYFGKACPVRGCYWKG